MPNIASVPSRMQDAIGRQPMPVPGSALVTYSGVGARLVVLAPALT